MADRTKTLADLGLTAREGRNPVLRGITLDSRAVEDGFLFAAMPGSAVHGASYIELALARGAVAILTDAAGARLAAQVLADSDAALIVAEDPREAIARA
ncbi:MAG: Mur ligase domain-containing protein, partial [Cypionkella sp.]|nr:Mur ligase domain-containing protein [Cypionkella sp.]